MVQQRNKTSNTKLFDLPDLVTHVYRRLAAQPDFALHRVYADEVQDFLQIELATFIRATPCPNEMFLTGDTAQAITRGVGFRFEDLRSLYHYAAEDANEAGSQRKIQVPEKALHLTYNYRSHGGILNLASSVIGLLEEFFPDSFDKLSKDCGFLDGPKPTLIESGELPNLALHLFGKKRDTGQIEFGAHQVILVPSEEELERVPTIFESCTVLTIAEAKGLEFDDVLLFNFFRGSQAQKEWRVVSGSEQLQQHHDQVQATSCAVKEVDIKRKCEPRKLDFDKEQHKILCSELKQLYTALTRARVNIWIFDQDTKIRDPMVHDLLDCPY